MTHAQPTQKSNILFRYVNLLNARLNLRFFYGIFGPHFRHLKFKSEETFSQIWQTKNQLEILETFFKSEKFFSKVVNKKLNSNARVHTV